MMETMLSNPYWSALKTEQAGIALGDDLARRYPADVIPFAGLAENSAEAMSALAGLLAPDEAIYVTGEDLPEVDELGRVSELQGWQMLYPTQGSPDLQEGGDTVRVRALEAGDAASMVSLTDVAFPGFFRSRTYTLGKYYGVYLDDKLISMAGERIALPGMREISAVCTHPNHTGKGYAAVLIGRLLRDHRAAGLQSMLHVSAANVRAIGLYERLGFEKSRPILFNRLRRR